VRASCPTYGNVPSSSPAGSSRHSVPRVGDAPVVLNVRRVSFQPGIDPCRSQPNCPSAADARASQLAPLARWRTSSVSRSDSLEASQTLHQLRHRGSSRAPRLCGRGLRRRSVACVELSVKSTSHDSATWPRRESKERCLRANVRRSRGTLRGVPQVQTRSASSTTSTSGSCQTSSSLPMPARGAYPLHQRTRPEAATPGGCQSDRTGP
jgi:hypothetical protein